MSSCKCQILHANRRQRISNLQSQYINCGRNIITWIPCQVYSNIAKQCASEASSIEVLARGCISGSSWLGQLTIVTSTQTARCISSILPCCAFDNFYTLLRQLSYHVSSGRCEILLSKHMHEREQWWLHFQDRMVWNAMYQKKKLAGDSRRVIGKWPRQTFPSTSLKLMFTHVFSCTSTMVKRC